MRSFSGFYFFLRIGIVIIIFVFKFTQLVRDPILAFGLAFLFFALTVAITRPYQKGYMNHIDTLILFNMALLGIALSSELFLLARVLLFLPLVLFVGTLFAQLNKFCCHCCVKTVQQRCVCYCCKKVMSSSDNFSSTRAVTPTAAQPLIQPTSTEISYSTCECVNNT